MNRLAMAFLTLLVTPAFGQMAAPATETTAAPVAEASYQNLLTLLLQDSVDILGRPIDYPDGNAVITTAIVEIPPGGETGLHHHEVPLVAYILEGTLTVDYGEHGIRVYEAGSAALEAVDWPHNGRNLGAVPVKLLAIYIGSDEATNTITETIQ